MAARGAHDTAYGLSRDGAGDVRDTFAAPAGDGEPVIDDAIGLLADRQTARFGHLVAPMGVRYVALVRRAAPNAGATRALTTLRVAGVARPNNSTSRSCKRNPT